MHKADRLLKIEFWCYEHSGIPAKRLPLRSPRRRPCLVVTTPKCQNQTGQMLDEVRTILCPPTRPPKPYGRRRHDSTRDV